MLLIAVIPFLIIFWFLLIRPQQQRMKDHQALVAELAVGDRVITAGGIHGTLVAVDEDTVELEAAEGIVFTMARPAIAKRVGPVDAAVAGEGPTEPELPPGPVDDPAGEDLEEGR